MSISDIRKRLAISERTDEIFNDGEPNWYGKDIKTLLELIDRMGNFIREVNDWSWPNAELTEEANVILKELEETA